jgi:hypothetical protein
MTLLLFWMEKTLTFLECGFGHFEDVLTPYFIYLSTLITTCELWLLAKVGFFPFPMS